MISKNNISIPDICHYFLHVHILSHENFTLGKCVNLRQNCQKQYFSGSSGIFFTLSQNFYRHGVRSVRDKYQVYGLGLGQDHGLVIFRNTQHWSQNSKQQ